MKYICAIITVLVFCNTTSGQSNKAIDSIEFLIKTSVNIQNKIKLLNDLSYEYLEIDPRKGADLANTALELAHKNGDKMLIAMSYKHLGTALYKRQILDSARINFEKSLEIYLKLKENKHLSSIFNEIGNIEADKGNFEKALVFYQKALKLFEKAKDEINTAKALSNIGALYIDLGNWEKMYQYTSKALEMHRRNNNKLGIAASLTNLADYFFQKGDSANIMRCLPEARELFHRIGARINESNVLGSIGDFYSMFANDQNKAIEYYNKAQKLLQEGENNNLRMDNYRKISLAYYKMKNYQKSLDFALEAVKVTDSSNISYMQINYYLLTYIYMGLKDFPKGEHAFDKYVELTNQVYQESQVKRIAEMEVKFQTEKKEKEILQLSSEKKQRTLLVYSLLGFIILGCIAIFFIFRNIYQKRTIVEHRLKQLEKEKQLLATQSVLQGEEAERSRLARDLHDGLGGLLSGVKLSLTSLKGNYALSDENVKKFDNTLNLLDSSIKEMRRISHNMMPEALTKFGLKDALQDFAYQINKEHNNTISFNYFGEYKRVSNPLETSLYRICLELINNAIKHAEADEIIVQIIQESNRLHLSVQDNGKGFDPKNINEIKSSGLKNIMARVESFNGRFDIDSRPGQGTEISVEFKID